jgi:hypothetical protein
MNRPKIALYYFPLPEKDRWFFGDRYVRRILRRIIRGKPRPGGIDMVFINLCKGLDLINIPYEVNLPFKKLEPHQIVCIFGRGINCLDGYKQKNSIVAGIALMSHPSEWPDLCQRYPVKRYLQHSEWCNDLYIPFFGPKICEDLWPVGIDTDFWKPTSNHTKEYFIIYNKIHWDKEKYRHELVDPIKKSLDEKGLKYIEIIYGKYKRAEYKKSLNGAIAMIVLAEHESQGLAYQEALSMNVPIIAWNPGKIMDPEYQIWGDFGKPASSVPYWDDRCGEFFSDLLEFEQKFALFYEKLQGNSYRYCPRSYILENLSLTICAQKFIEIVEKVSEET